VNAYGSYLRQRGREMRDTLKELDRPGGVIPVTPEAVGDLIDEVRRLRDTAKHQSIRCPECSGLNAERDARFARPRDYSPELKLMSELHTNAADLLVVAGKIVATHDTEMVRQFYCGEIRTRITALCDALSAFENGERC